MFGRSMSPVTLQVWLTVVGESMVTYRLLLELNVPRGEKQQVLARSTLMPSVLVLSAVLTRASVFRLPEFLICPIGVVMLADALPRV